MYTVIATVPVATLLVVFYNYAKTNPWFSSFVSLENYALLFIAFFAYVLVIFFLTVSTFFFSVKGVHFVSITAIACFWAVQAAFSHTILMESRGFSLVIDYIGLFGAGTQFNFSLNMDFISFSFLFLTTSIGVCALAYSITYFKNEPNCDRFILCLNWFIITMSLLVIADNCFLLFLG